MGRKRKSNKIAKVHEHLEGLNLKINEFGEIESNIDINKINEFLTKEVPDKKLINRLDDKYQQEFKKLGLGGPDEDEKDYHVEDNKEPEDEDFDSIMKIDDTE